MTLDDIDTPAVLIDLDRVEANLARAQSYADAQGLDLRPHVKTHKLPRFARAQMALGAAGITAQKLAEAEAMAEAGLADIFLPYNIIGPAKLTRLAALAGRVGLSVTCDSAEVLAGYAATFTSPHEPLAVLVECDTGAARCGVQTPAAALTLARQVAAAPGLRFGGLMTYPPREAEAAADAWLIAARALLTAAGLPPPVISSGGSPGLYRAHRITAATEYRPGTYIYSDRMQVAWGLGGWDDCAMTVLTTVVSRPTATRAILDAGSKALAADLCPLPGHGRITAYPDAIITGLSEEHGHVDLTGCATGPAIGERVRVIPNHACVVTNLHDRVHLIRGDVVEEIATVTSRGRLT